METVKLTTCDTSLYADELKAILQMNGIECFVNDATKGEVIGSIGGTPAGFEVYVNSNDYDASLRIWNSIKQKRDEQLPWCPKCGNEDVGKTVVHRKHGPIWMILLCIMVSILCIVLSFVNPDMIYTPGALWVVAVIIWFKSYNVVIYHCNSCGKEFKRVK